MEIFSEQNGASSDSGKEITGSLKKKKKKIEEYDGIKSRNRICADSCVPNRRCV